MKTKILTSIILLSVPVFASAATHPVGTNVINNGTVSMVTADSHLRPYTSAGAFLSYGFNSWAKVPSANPDDLALPTGDFIPPRDGKVMCSDRGADKGTCYLITESKRAGFTSSDIFTGLGFNFKYVLTGDVSFLSATQNIDNAAQAHRPGTLVNDDGTIKLVASGGSVGIPSMDVLDSWGYSLTDVVAANPADKTMTQIDILSNRIAGQLAFTPSSPSPSSPTPISYQTPSGGPYQTPIPTIIITNPFTGVPRLFFVSTDPQIGKTQYDFAIDLSIPETVDDQQAQVYSFRCVTPLNPGGISFPTTGLYAYDNLTILGSIFPIDLGQGRYTCEFRFKQGTFISNSINFNFDGTNLSF
ncbi:MAG: hypothetical protein ABI643_02820 [Candidatus Doudnabacteria bacterium]